MESFQLPNLFYGPLIPAIFELRLHRFAAEIVLDSTVETVHIPNSGRLRELLFLGNTVLLHDEGHPGRQTRHTLVGAKVEGGWAYIDSRLPNRILQRCWKQIPLLSEYRQAWPEVGFGSSRFDMALQREEEPLTLLEAKCVTLVQDGTGRFPDAPTERGQRHLQELGHAVQLGHRGIVIFFAQHPTASVVEANGGTDPKFARLMREAAAKGVEFFGFRVVINENGLSLTPIPVEI